MPAPRYANQSQENTLWLALTGLWAVGGALAWLAALGTAATWMASPSWLVVFSSLTFAVSAALRLPILSSKPQTTLANDHGVWLLTALANINWLGFFILHAPQWADAIPAALIWLLSEIWFFTTATRSKALPWLSEIGSDLWFRWNQLGSDSSTNLDDRETTFEPGPGLEGGGEIERRVVDGHDEQGRRYLSGEIGILLTPDKATETVVVGFSPAFVGDPDVDLECEADGVDVRLINCTPTGMRIGIRGLSLTDPLNFTLQWYAIEVELGDKPRLAATTRILP